jgi:hypothetical protein
MGPQARRGAGATDDDFEGNVMMKTRNEKNSFFR